VARCLKIFSAVMAGGAVSLAGQADLSNRAPAAAAARLPAARIESDRDGLGYHARSRSFVICREAGVRVLDFKDPRSFAALWVPTNFTSGRVMVLLHGTGGTAYDELKDELPSARRHRYMVVALQWLDRETGRYLDAPVVLELIERALHHAAERYHADPDRAALCGFSRGGAVSYEVAWRDAGRHRHFRLIICHSGGVPPDSVVAPGEGWHPDRFFGALNRGELGASALKGCNFFLYSGDRDEQWGLRMSAQMANAARVLPLAGARVLEWVRDPEGGHRGYRTRADIQEKAIRYFLRAERE
jgi:predicted esterase